MGRASRCDDARVTIQPDAVAQRLSRMRRRSTAERQPVGEGSYLQSLEAKGQSPKSYGSANTNSDRPAAAAMYCLPFTAYVIGLFNICAPSWLFHSSVPVRASNACR